MLLKKIKESLTVRIFCITCFILFTASAITFAFIALATPSTYTTVMTDDLQKKTENFVKILSVTEYKDSASLINNFIANEANVIILNSDGTLAQLPDNFAFYPVFEDNNIVVVTSVESNSSEYVNSKNFQVSMTVSDMSVRVADMMNYKFSFSDSDEVYSLYVSPRVEKATNQAVMALQSVAPGLLILMLCFSVLCSLFYSRYITQPIVHISNISQRMKNLDFSLKCKEKRKDEIGILGNNLDEMSVKLSMTLDELQHANEALQQDIDQERELEKQRLAFFSAVSHELKTPVTILKGQLTGMLEGIDIYQDRDKYLAKSLQVTGRMETIIQEILMVSRMESEGFTLNLQEVEINKLLDSQLQIYEDLFEQKNITLSKEYYSDMVLWADNKLLIKVLDNVLSNAFFYATDNECIKIKLFEDSLYNVISIENTGSSIPEEALPHVFEAFYRAESSRNRRTGGSGLGLYIVKIILDHHGAEYCIENTEKGVKFTIRFPEVRVF